MEKYAMIDKELTPPVEEKQLSKEAQTQAEELEKLADSPEQRLAKQAEKQVR